MYHEARIKMFVSIHLAVLVTCIDTAQSVNFIITTTCDIFHVIQRMELLNHVL